MTTYDVLFQVKYDFPSKPNRRQLREMLAAIDQAISKVDLAPIFSSDRPILPHPGFAVTKHPNGNQRGRKRR